MFKKMLCGFLLFNVSISAMAYCSKNPAYTGQWPSEWQPFDTTTGIQRYWNQANNDGGRLTLSGKINIASDLVQPVGSILANTGPMEMVQYGRRYTPFDPEQVLYVCSSDEEGLLYEGYVVNRADDRGHLVTEPNMPENTYASIVQRLGWRAKNLTTGKYFTHKWQLRPFTGLDRDIYGRLLVKAKNFSAVEFEFIKVPSPVMTDLGSYNAPNTSNFGLYFSPFAYIFIISHNTGPTATPTNRIPRCYEGADYFTCPASGDLYPYIPASISNVDQARVGRYAGCQIVSVTPSVTFDPISVPELNTGGSRRGKIEITYNCDNNAFFGISAESHALGFKVTDASKNVANSFGFKTTGTAVTKLFSNNYGDSGVARGVAIDIFPEHYPVPMNWLTNNSLLEGGNLAGWYKPNGIRVNALTEPFAVYKARYDVKLSKFTPLSQPDVSVTAGTVYATAEVLLILQ
ncbi:fimbrial protein [Shewanella putrefaciens]|uniref:fimbrial protein n=1 Tax=Shewanella putrefaciens TaxID=24 RepID=UPI0028644829|nr:fimbrial protein [Shewanella putrefaciens]MDR6965087.1 hypothetical protein [Shewanella putrefaciens]